MVKRVPYLRDVHSTILILRELGMACERTKDGSIEVETEVRWIRENSSLMRTEASPGMGVRFINMPASDAQTIQKFLESRESLLYDDE